MTIVILSRHGNTFEKKQEPIWVGARTDIPLTKTGRDQAKLIGNALKNSSLVPKRTITGPLRRTIETTEIALKIAGISSDQVEVDERLREIDYGLWEGKSSGSIINLGLESELRLWENFGIWPNSAEWPLTKEHYINCITQVIDTVVCSNLDPTLIVSSNGLFRILSELITGKNSNNKMATGNMSILEVQNGNILKIIRWNIHPIDFESCCTGITK